MINFYNFPSKLTVIFDGGLILSKNDNIKPQVVDLKYLGTESKNGVLFEEQNCNFSHYYILLYVLNTTLYYSM